MLVPLLDVIMEHAADERVLLTSFSARTLAQIRKLGYRGQIGMSQRDAAFFVLGPRWLRWLTRRGASRLHRDAGDGNARVLELHLEDAAWAD